MRNIIIPHLHKFLYTKTKKNTIEETLISAQNQLNCFLKITLT